MSPMRRFAHARRARLNRERYETETRDASARGEPDHWIAFAGGPPWPERRGWFAMLGIPELEPTGAIDDPREREALMAASTDA